MINLNFETLTPLHISNGNQLAYNLEYIVFDNFIAKLNVLKSAEKIAKARLFNFNNNYSFNQVIKIVGENKHIFSIDTFDYKVFAEKQFLNYLQAESRNGQKIIQEFINSNGNFYIPASSIKGMLTTILNRDINNNPLGINPNKPSILDKFVITDSDYIDANNFVVDIADRPPSINIMMLDSGVEFTSKIRKMGNLSIQDLRNKLQTYSFSQMKKAEQFVNKFKDMEKIPKGATAYYKIIENMLHQINLEENQYLVNLGFGGGSYYKIYTNVEIPKFKSKDKTKRNVEEEAHTTFSVNIENEIYQLGWCTLKIEEE